MDITYMKYYVAYCGPNPVTAKHNMKSPQSEKKNKQNTGIGETTSTKESNRTQISSSLVKNLVSFKNLLQDYV